MVRTLAWMLTTVCMIGCAGTTIPDGGVGSTADPVAEDTEAEVQRDCSACELEMAQGGCVDADACLALCEDAPHWSPDIELAFETCVTSDPLCFTTLEQCVLSELHPSPIEALLRVTAEGFDAADGTRVQAVWEASGRRVLATTALEDGGFDFVADGTVSVMDPGLLLLYVDRNGDGRCGRGDITRSARVQIEGAWEAPEYRVELVASETGEATFVCDFI